MRSPLAAATLAVFLLAGVGVIDLLTGRNASLMLLYLIPVSIAALAVGDKAATLLAIAAASVATVIRLSGDPLSPPEWWNASTRLAILLAWGLLLGRLRAQPGAGVLLRQLRVMLPVVVLLGLLGSGAAFLLEGEESLRARSTANSNPTAPRPEGVLAELAEALADCLATSRPLLLGSRDPAGVSCVAVVTTGSVQDALPSNTADYNGGPGTTLGALYFFDRANVRNPVDDYNWHQTRLRRFLQNQREVNERAAQASRDLAERAMELAEQLDDARALPPRVVAIGYREKRNWPGYCLMSLDSAVAANDLAAARRWAMELAAATFALDDLHRWLGFLVENQLQALEFQKLGSMLYADPAFADSPYDTHTTICQFPSGSLGLNGVTSFLEVERQAERLLTIPTDWESALKVTAPWKHGSIWVPPGLRDAYLKLHNTLSPANQKTWRQAARMPYEHSYMVNMLFRTWKADALDALAETLRRFDAAHPQATVGELMDAIMYRGHAFAGIEWADRYQPELMNPLEQKVFETDRERLLAAVQLGSRYNRQRDGYGVTFTLRDALARRIFDCVRVTDTILAAHRNSGGASVGFVQWSAGSAAHTVVAGFESHDSQPRTFLLDGMSHAPQPETWPDAYFHGHDWPPGFDGPPPPFSAELFARGIDNYIWVEGYVIRGPHAGTLMRFAVPWLAGRDKSDSQKVFAGPYPE